MPLAEHVRELRKRAVRAAAAFGVAAVAGYLLFDQLLDLLRAPVEQVAAEREASLNYSTVTAAFDLRIRLAILSGLVLSAPVWSYQLMAFLLPGLTRRERRHVVGFLAAAVPLFVAGCAFGLMLFPHMVRVLTGFSPDADSTILDASTYVDFVIKFVLAIGLSFVLPVLVVMANVLGLVSSRTIRRSWRGIVVVITLFSALVTPAADVLSMFFVAVPMAALFGAAVAITHVHDRRSLARADAERAGELV
ncbi:MAG: twin-arginine translocase subunit TatC [Nocardioides sp.]|nr:twin-arginine translocase subunit TatC [Nocardioides sp.]